ncbi:DNA-directed RNA polymerase subunit beta' [Candidatus Poribacteria bacterium]
MEIRFVCDHDSLTERHGRFILEPLDKGAGAVIGNALRRVLLSQLDGAAVTAVKFRGVLHEFAPIPGAVEDTMEVIRNLRRLDLRVSRPGPKNLRISEKGGVVTARDLETDDEVVLLNPAAHIVTLADGAKLSAEIEVDTGTGFREAKPGEREPGVIAVDADFCPVQRAVYSVKELEENQEFLSVELYTNGSINPIDAVKKAAAILKSGLTEENLISGDFDNTSGTFVIDAGGHTIGSILCWALMSYSNGQKSGDGCEPVVFADYAAQTDGKLTLEVQTDGDLGPKEALSLAQQRLVKMMDVLQSPPVKERGHPSMTMLPSSSGISNGSISFGDASSFWRAPDLLDVQRSSYERFLQRNTSPQDRKRQGLEKILVETFPVENGGLILDCLGYSCGAPSRSPAECLDLSVTYSLPVTLRMRLTVEKNPSDTERVVEEEVALGEIPLLDDDGTFIIKGLRRTVIGQLIGADADDLNDLAKKRVKLVGDFLYEQTTEAFERLRAIIEERMAVEDSTDPTPSALLCTTDPEGRSNVEPVVAAVNKFFTSNQFSQITQETNPLDKITHNRRLSQRVDGRSVEDIPDKPRFLHHSTYGRLDPLETPEGPNVGLISTLAIHAQIDEKGNIKTPYHKVEKKKISDQVIYLSAQEESDLIISPASSPLTEKSVAARVGGDVRRVAPKEVDYVDAFEQQTLGLSTSLIPLLEHDDPNRALMGSNMQRQAVPLVFAEQPLVQSGAEVKMALDSREAVAAERDGVVKRVTAEKMEITADEGGTDAYHLLKHRPAGSFRTWINQKPIVSIGQKVTAGQVIADGSSSKNGSLSLGRNILAAYMPWEGYNFEDAILVSEKLIKEDVLTSLHIQTCKAEIRDTRYGREVFTKQPPGAAESELSHLDSDGVAKVGSWVSEGDVLVGKVTPKSGELSPEDKLLSVLTEHGGTNYSDASLRVLPGTTGRVTRVLRLSRAKGDPLPKGVHEVVKVEITAKRKAKVGDKLSGRHGNKGTISRILPEEDMPFMSDGTPIEMALSPLGVPTRMNLGQILEVHLGRAAKALGVNVISPPYDGPTLPQIKELLSRASLPESGMEKLCDGRNGRAMDSEITVGYRYTMKLIHMVDDKIHARSTGPYSFFTQQPTGGKAHFGGQRFGEMETWALEAYGAAYTLRELLTVKSDDVVGRRKMYESLLKGSESTLTPSMPEALRKLILCLRGATFDMKGHTKSGEGSISSVDDITAMTIALASPEKIRGEWSHGAVHEESAAWENRKPAPGGLFCEEIFGPIRDWQCQCGKLSGSSLEGQICDECGVEVGPASLRNERMGHIDLATPVCHNWFLAAKPSPIAVLLDMNVNDIKKVVYYESYVVTDGGDTDLQRKQVLSAEEHEAKRKEHGEEAFQAETGAGVIRELLSGVDLAKRMESLDDPQQKLMVKSLQESGVKPEWMILECMPVIPPGMRPSAYLEGGGVATLDLNELYTRVISRSSKYRELAAIGGPEAHETARMIQESVDSLLGNGRRSKGETGTLRSISDLLKGKSGMFRQNLLGKRVDYSGRSVIVVGPDLKLDECGLPESMALELFKPFIVHKLLSSGAAHNISSAHRMVDAQAAEAREAVKEIASEHLIMLNRAPTLHRVGIQTFKPVLTDTSAIRLHPLVCVGFNADFDGDQMAVHIPLSSETQEEARQLMLSQKNVLSAAHGGTIAQPSQDMIVGCYYLTRDNSADGEAKAEFTNIPEVKKAYELGRMGLHDSIQFQTNGEKINTTVGRVLFNEIVPSGLGRFINRQMDKRSIFRLVEECHARLGEDETIRFLNNLDDLGFKYATRFGASVGMNMFQSITDGDKLLEKAERSDSRIRNKLAKGEMSPEEAIEQRLDVWSGLTDELADSAMESLSPDGTNSVLLMMASGARGKPSHLKNTMGRIGLVTKATGELFDTPIASNYIEGLSALEHFMMTAGARSGLIDTAIRAGRAGYLMRKMVSASQDVVITEEDCGTSDGITMTALTSGEEVVRRLSVRISGRSAAQDVTHPKTGAVIVAAGTIINDDMAQKIEEADIQEVKVRSPLTCETNYGVCAKCYGVDLATGAMTKLGDPVGIIAGAAGGEPATQLTFRTFGMKLGSDYISTGLPRLDELMEARESAKIIVDGSSMTLENVLSQKGEEVFGSLMLDELMKLYGYYGLSVNDKHFEILLGCMLSQVRITNAGDTSFYVGELVKKSQLRLENQKVGADEQASAEPVLMGMHKAALSTDSFLAAAAFGDTVNVLAQAAIRGSRDELRGMRENLIIGKLIPAGTGFRV